MSAFLFTPTSRYYGLATTTLETADHQMIPYLVRRFLPDPARFALLTEHVVTDGERLDNVTEQYFGDPEAFWRLCDANRAMRPEELVERMGRRLRITLPEGIPGTPNA
jgi:hypothetical protein